MRKGFTLIELLLVVVIIGIIAALVLPKFGDVKERAYTAAMQNDLRNLATAQELEFELNDAYFVGTITEESTDAPISVSDKVTIEVAGVGSPVRSYIATATHAGTQVSCELNRDSGEAMDCR